MLLVDVEFNMNLSKIEGNTQDKEIFAALATTVIYNMVTHFLLQRKSWAKHRKTRGMLWGGREVWSRK